MGLRVRAFRRTDLPAAARLLAARHAAHRRAVPLLARADPRAFVARELDHGARGVVAERGGAVVGYLLARRGESGLWGRHVWIHRAGHASRDAETARELYAAAAERWSAERRRRHFVVVPDRAADLEPWYGLGFARMHEYAVRRTGSRAVAPPAGYAVRRGTVADLEIALLLEPILPAHQRRSPSFSGIPPEARRATRASWKETLEDPTAAYFVVERRGRPVGHSILYRPEELDLGDPDRCVYLGHTSVRPALRERGLGLAVTAHVLRWAKDEGYEWMITNWRVTNLLASRFWPRRGFRRTFVRMERTIPA